MRLLLCSYRLAGHAGALRAPAADAAVADLLEAQLPFQTLQDGNALVMDGDTIRVARAR